MSKLGTKGQSHSSRAVGQRKQVQATGRDSSPHSKYPGYLKMRLASLHWCHFIFTLCRRHEVPVSRAGQNLTRVRQYWAGHSRARQNRSLPSRPRETLSCGGGLSHLATDFCPPAPGERTLVRKTNRVKGEIPAPRALGKAGPCPFDPNPLPATGCVLHTYITSSPSSFLLTQDSWARLLGLILTGLEPSFSYLSPQPRPETKGLVSPGLGRQGKEAKGGSATKELKGESKTTDSVTDHDLGQARHSAGQEDNRK